VTHFAFLHTLHVHAQHIDRAARLAASIRDSVSAICFYAETQASLYARAGAPGRHYLLVEGESAWLQRFFAIPHCPQVSGVVALVNDDAGPADLARLMLADADICLQGSAHPRVILAALSALARMERRLLVASGGAPTHDATEYGHAPRSAH
jgi:hypothetical protein